MDRSQGSHNAGRCFVYTATTFHIHIVCTLCVPLRSCSIAMEPPILFLNTLGRQQTSIHHRSCMDRSQGSQNASRCIRLHSDHLSLTHGVYPLWFLSLHPAQLWWSLQFLNIYIYWTGSEHLFHNRSCMDRSQGSQSASRCFVYTATTSFTCMHMVCTLRDPFRSVNCDGAFNFSIYIYSTGSEHLFHNRSCMDLSQSSQNASRCFVYTATTFHVCTHCVYPVCSFQILLNCDGATYFISEYIGQAANINSSSQLHGSIPGLSECQSLLRLHSDHLSLTHGVYPLWFLSLHPAQLWWGLQFLNKYIGQAANTYFTIAAAWIDPRALRVQVAASFTQRPPFTCMHMVCTLRDPFRSVNCDGAFNFSIYIYTTGSEHLFHNRSCMDRSQSSQNAIVAAAFTQRPPFMYIHIVCTLCVPFRSCSIVMEPPILFLNTLGRQRTPIWQSQLHGSIPGRSEC